MPADFGRPGPPRPSIEVPRSPSWPPLRRCPATLAVTAALTVFFLVEWAVGAFSADPIPLLALGANSSVLVKAGEWQRLVTGNLLHGNLIHFVLNAVTLLYVGGLFELFLGPRRFLAILLFSCLGGSAASAFLTDAMIAVGVSTGILGLLGAYLVFTWRFSNDRRRTLRSLGFLLLVIVAVSLPIEWLLARLFFMRVDHFGHLGGLLAGMLFVTVTIRERTVPALKRARFDPVALWASAILTLLFLGAAARTAVAYAREGLAPTAATFLALLETPEGPDGELAYHFFYNNAAWVLATGHESTREQLEVAAAGMGWAEEGEARETVAERDTLATLLYRLGRYDDAVRLEREVLGLSLEREVIEMYRLEHEDIAFFASQLARFEWARYLEHGPVVEYGSRVPGAFLARASGAGCDAREPSPPAAGPRLERGLVLSTVGWGEAVEIHVLLIRDDAPLALLKVEAGPDAPAWLEYGELDDEMLACDVRPVVTLAQKIEPPERPVLWWRWKMSEEAAELP